MQTINQEIAEPRAVGWVGFEDDNARRAWTPTTIERWLEQTEAGTREPEPEPVRALLVKLELAGRSLDIITIMETNTA